MAILGKRRRRRLMRVFRSARALSGPRAPVAQQGAEGVGTPRPKHRAQTPDVAAAARTVLGDRSRRIALAALLALAIAAAHAATAGVYVVSGARVIGNARLGGAAVYAASGLDGARAFTIDGPEAARRILDALPEVRAARVTVRLPARVTIAIQETRPMLAWQSGPSLLLIDETGRAIVPTADGAAALDLPQVADLSEAPLGLGQQLPEGRLAAALAYAQVFGDLVYRPDDGFIATVAGNYEVRLGEAAAQLPVQRLALGALQNHLGRSKGDVFVDLRFPAHPVYRFATPGGQR